jgi:hypothetical protein
VQNDIYMSKHLYVVICALAILGTVPFGNCVAHAEGKGGGGGGGSGPGGLFGKAARVGYLYGPGYGLKNVGIAQAPAIELMDNLTAYAIEADTSYPVGIHFALREGFNQDTRTSFNGGAVTRGEAYFTTWNLGLKIYLPIPYFQPWFGAGFLGGTGAITHPPTRGNDDGLAAFENETQSIWGKYLHGGVDLWFGSFGLRAAYQVDHVQSKDFWKLNKTPINYSWSRWEFGLVAGGDFGN